MKSFSLEIDEFSDDDYTLIGIHATLEDFQLAYLINKKLKFYLKRADFNIEVKRKSEVLSYTIFEYSNEELSYNVYLLSNTVISENELNNFGLFDTLETKSFLIAEKKNVDFFIKIEGFITDEIVTNFINQINTIPQVITSYTIEANTLKSKNFLIF